MGTSWFNILNAKDNDDNDDDVNNNDNDGFRPIPWAPVGSTS